MRARTSGWASRGRCGAVHETHKKSRGEERGSGASDEGWVTVARPAGESVSEALGEAETEAAGRVLLNSRRVLEVEVTAEVVALARDDSTAEPAEAAGACGCASMTRTASCVMRSVV